MQSYRPAADHCKHQIKTLPVEAVKVISEATPIACPLRTESQIGWRMDEEVRQVAGVGSSSRNLSWKQLERWNVAVTSGLKAWWFGRFGKSKSLDTVGSILGHRAIVTTSHAHQYHYYHYCILPQYHWFSIYSIFTSRFFEIRSNLCQAAANELVPTGTEPGNALGTKFPSFWL